MVGVNFPINNEERRSSEKVGAVWDAPRTVYDAGSKRKQTIAPVLTEVGNFRKVLRVSTSTKCNLPSKISNVSLFTTLATQRLFI